MEYVASLGCQTHFYDNPYHPLVWSWGVPHADTVIYLARYGGAPKFLLQPLGTCKRASSVFFPYCYAIKSLNITMYVAEWQYQPRFQVVRVASFVRLDIRQMHFAVDVISTKHQHNAGPLQRISNQFCHRQTTVSCVYLGQMLFMSGTRWHSQVTNAIQIILLNIYVNFLIIVLKCDVSFKLTLTTLEKMLSGTGKVENSVEIPCGNCDTKIITQYPNIIHNCCTLTITLFHLATFMRTFIRSFIHSFICHSDKKGDPCMFH